MRRRSRGPARPRALPFTPAGCLGLVLAMAGPALATAQAGFMVQDALAVQSVQLWDLSRDGRWAVVAVSALEDRLGTDNHRFGDPTYLAPRRAEIRIVDAETGAARRLFDRSAQVEAAVWSPDAARLALLVRSGDGFEYRVWERERDRFRIIRLPGATLAAANSRLRPVWSQDGATLILPIRAGDWPGRAGSAFRALVEGPVVVLSSESPFLEWEAVRRMAGLHALAAYDVASGRAREILPETALLDLEVTADGRLRYTLDITETTDYGRIFGTDGRVVVRDVDGGEPVIVIENVEQLGPTIWSDDGLTYAYAKDGVVWLGHVDEAEDRRLLGGKAAGPAGPDTAARPAAPPEAGTPATADTAKAIRFSPVSFSPAATRLIAAAEGSHWFVDVATGDTLPRFLASDPEQEDAPSHRVIGWTGEDAVLVQRDSRTEWLREIHRYSATGDGDLLHSTAELLRDARIARDGSVVLFQAAPANRPTDLYAADPDMGRVRRLVESNPALGPRTLARAELVRYLDADGKELSAVLYYPLAYREGERYPTIFHIYETFHDPVFDAFVNVMTSHGYAVLRPSVSLERGYPGEGWLKGVTAAANELVRRGIADPKRLAVQGTSYGGYAVNLLVTQTQRFAAAVNVSGKVNMVSFYTDSPRLGTRNIHAPENSQDRIGATLWEQPQKYIAHSAIMFADRIRTPMLLIGGDQDHNVPNRQLMEMYYALRRLGRDVTWVTYVHGGHGVPTADEAMVRDYYGRILEFYGRHLAPPSAAEGDEAVAEGNP
jgi:dipeptidyl aminopeptidase/acylaminoacyl peptidase